MDKKDELGDIYDDLDDRVGARTRKTINLLAAEKLKNGSGDIGERIREINTKYNNWLDNDGHKI